MGPRGSSQVMWCQDRYVGYKVKKSIGDMARLSKLNEVKAIKERCKIPRF